MVLNQPCFLKIVRWASHSHFCRSNHVDITVSYGSIVHNDTVLQLVSVFMKGVLNSMLLLALASTNESRASGFTVSSSSFSSSRRVVRSRSLDSKLWGGVLSKSAILRRANRKSRNTTEYNPNVSCRRQLSKPFLTDAIDEALHRQELILRALEVERSKIKGTTEGYRSSTKSKKKNQLCSIDRRNRDVHETIMSLRNLKMTLRSQVDEDSPSSMEDVRDSLIRFGFASVLQQPPELWKTNRHNRRDGREFGRPVDFDGLVFYSPLGVPILIGKPKAHKDEILRRISQGDDLWFQVHDYNGSRVLLRSSLKKGFKGSKACRQMAADLAARYSDWYPIHHHEQPKGSTSISEEKTRPYRVPVMYTDSKHVAKRGGKVGQMRQRKRLGNMYGYPSNVEALTRGKDA